MATLKEIDFDPFAGSPVGKTLPFDRNAALAETDKALSLPAGFSAAQIQVESGGNPKARSSAGARGLAQVMPETLAVVSKRLGRELDPDNEKDAVDIHREVMRENLAKFKDPAKALMAYNGGWNPDKWGNPETAAYVGKVKGAMKSGQNPIMATAEKVTNAVIPSAQAAQAPKEATLHEVDFDPFAAPAAPAATKRSMIDELGRQLGLTVRAGVKGVASIPVMMSDSVTPMVNTGLDAVAGKGNGPRFKNAGQALERMLSAAGLPEPENARERVVQDAASAVAGAGSMVKGGLGLAKYASGPVVQGVGRTLAAGPGLQGLSAATGAGASGEVRENGGGAGAQMAAGLAGGLAPGLAPAAAKASVRGLLRGGEKGRLTAESNVAAFEAAGTSPTLAQATDGRLARATESLLAKTPGSAGVIAKRAQQQADDMAASVQRLSDDLAPGANPTNAGEAIERGAIAFKEGTKKLQQQLYADLDKHIPADTPIEVTSTAAALKELNADIPGAPNLSAFFKNSKIFGIDKALQADLEKAMGGGVSTTAEGVGTLPYEAIKKMRSLVGRELADNSFVSDVPRSKWSALYGALSDDLGVAAKVAGPEAEKSWQWANQYTRTQMERLDQIKGIMSRDTPEKIFSSAISGTADGATTITRVMSILPKQERREVTAALLQHMGRATPGQQNAIGEAFSSETFLTNLSKFSPEARKTIFGRVSDKELVEKIGQLARVAESRREGGRVFANPSGTAPAMAQTAVGGALGLAALSAAGGNFLPLAKVAAVPIGAHMVSKFLTGPTAAKMAATRTPIIKGTQASVVGAVTRINNVTPPPEATLHEVDFDPFAQPAPNADPAQQTTPEPVRMELGGMAEPDDETPVDPAQVPGVMDDEVLDDDAPRDSGQSAAEIDPAHAFTSQPRPDGTLAIAGDTQALRTMLAAAGIPARSLVPMKNGLLVGRSQAGKVQEAIDRMNAPAPEATAAAPVDMPPEAMAEAAPTEGQGMPQEFASNQAQAPEEYTQTAINSGVEQQPEVAMAQADAQGAPQDMQMAQVSEAQPQAEAPAAMSEPVQSAPVDRIQRLRDSGEHKVAEMLQRSQDRDKTMGDVQTELASMQAASPDLPHHGDSVFNDHYQQQRLAGSKPAEASAHAGMVSAVHLAAPQIGMSEAAVRALVGKLRDLPIDEAPGFVERFTKALIGKGVIQPFDGSTRLASMLEQARDSAMHGALDSLYGDNPATTQS